MKRNLIEALESRQMLSASITLDLNEYGSMMLTIQTSNKTDNVIITNMTEFNGDSQLVNLKVTCGGKDQMYTHASTSATDQVVGIQINTGAGNDRIHIVNKDDWSNSGKGLPMLMVDAGAGKDSILCEGGFCLVEGGPGNDYIVGRTDREDGGRYNMAFSLYGQEGNDTIIGSKNGDALGGGEGNDILIAGDGDDYIQFGEGNDLVLAGAGNDYMVKGYADKSRCIIIGGGGNDTLAVFTWGGQDMPLNTTFSRLIISSVENYVIDKMG